MLRNELLFPFVFLQYNAHWWLLDIKHLFSEAAIEATQIGKSAINITMQNLEFTPFSLLKVLGLIFSVYLSVHIILKQNISKYID